MAKKSTKDGKLIYSKEEKIARLLKYLKENTDESHPASIPLIEYFFKKKGYIDFFGNKNTRKNMIKDLVMSLNTDFEGNLLPKEEWVIVYRDFVRDQGIESAEGKSHHICDIYYNHPFTSKEIDSLISSLENNDDLSEEEKQNLKSKINKHLKSSCYFWTPSSPIRRLAEEKGYQRKRPVARNWNNLSKYNDSFQDDYFSDYDDDEYYDDYEL